MRNFERVKCTLLLLCTISTAFVSCDDFTQQNDTKTVGLEDPSVDATVKAALENGSVSEVVVRKDLLLFPVNAPNLVIAHSQEIHAVPQKNGSNATDGKPVAAEVAEVNEYSLSQLVNDTDNDTTSQGIAIPASSFSNGSENDSVLEPGKLLEIVSGFNLSNGVATEKVPLPSEVQNFSLPKHSIVDLLSKSLPQADDAAPMIEPSTEASSYYVEKRSVDDYDDDDEDDDSQSNSSESTEDDDSQSNDTELEKRSVESDEKDDSSDSKSDESSTTESGSSTTTETVKRSIDSGNDVDSSSTTENGSSSTTESSTSTDIAKRSIDSDEDDSKSDSVEESTLKTSTSISSMKTKRSAEEDDDDDDDSSSNRTEYYDHVVSKSSETIDSQAESSSMHKSRKESLVRDSEDDMDVAEDIVFRPLFRYRQETRLRQRYPSYARSRNYGNQYRYRTDDSDYE